MVGQSPGTTSTHLTYGSHQVLRRIPARFLPMLAFMLLGMTLVFTRDRARDRHLVGQRGTDMVELYCQIIDRELESVAAVLLHFADQSLLKDFIDDPASRASLEREYLRYCKVSNRVDQIRLIGQDGSEELRVNHAGGEPTAVPVAELQPKAKRYYVRNAQFLEEDQIYVSPFDLNVEHDRIQEPWNPVWRLATPVFDRSGRKHGILTVNYLGQNLLDRLSSVASQAPGWTWLLNRDGYYLEGPTRESSWGFMFDRSPTFAADYGDAWSKIQGGASGAFTNDDGMFTFQTLTPLKRRLADSDARAGEDLKVVLFVPTDELYAASRATFQRLALGTCAVAIILFGVAWRLAFVGAVREQRERELEASEKRTRVLSRRVLHAEETERKSLARDLHDEVGQLATSVTIDLKRARKSTDLEAKDEMIDRSLEGTEHLLRSMHEISGKLRSSALDDLGLRVALITCGEEFESRTGVPVDMDLAFEDDRLNERVAENIYRIVQESLTNVTRHAKADRVGLRVRMDGEALCVSVQDFGVGFDPASADPERLGLIGMRERAELLGGTFEIESTPDDGTTVTAILPIDGDPFMESES